MAVDRLQVLCRSLAGFWYYNIPRSGKTNPGRGKSHILSRLINVGGSTLKVVSSSSVLIALSVIGRLALLNERFPDGVLIPQAVWRCVVERGQGRPGACTVASAPWITTCQVQDGTLISGLCLGLKLEKAETLALALERRSKIVLLDGKSPCQVARRLNLRVMGTVRLLIWARRVGLIERLQDQLDILRARGDFYLSHTVYEVALRAVGETL